MAGPAFSRLPPPGRARARHLALLSLRHWDACGAVLKPHLRRHPPAEVAAALRTATAEHLAEGAELAGLVSATVTAIRQGGARMDGFAGLANAVLRKLADSPRDLWDRQPAQAMPGWLRGRVMSAYGKSTAIRVEAAHRAGAPLDLTPRTGNAAALAAVTGGTAIPTGSVRLAGNPALATLPGFEEGAFWVQDAAAALPARALHAQAGERILDLCAAPGGKTMQLAAAGAEVTALDISGPRLKRLAENLARTGLAARAVTSDALTWVPDAPFDAVLLDAPCSATGTIRRHPDLPFVRLAASLRDLTALQSALIDRAVGFLRPGGRLVYATCSLLPEEGERQIAAALARHAGLVPDPEATVLAGVEAEWRSPEGWLRTRPDYWPEMGGLDGFFIAALRKDD
jgi:16S rRNA (cytosine967-C5)-methyltransferase